MSSVTMSGSSACTFSNASTPLRAVPHTRNPSSEVIISATTLRMNALSSTTSTERTSEDTGAFGHRPHGHFAVGHIERHGAAVIATRVFGHHRNLRLEQRLARTQNIPHPNILAAQFQQLAEQPCAA